MPGTFVKGSDLGSSSWLGCTVACIVASTESKGIWLIRPNTNSDSFVVTWYKVHPANVYASPLEIVNFQK